MRFIENGPDVPDELLAARDQGRVIFFCGAGVSQAFVGLSNFVDLASLVVDELGSLSGSRARQLLEAAKFKLPSGEKVGIAVDKLFSLLDQEFEPAEVRGAVARALTPKDDPDLKAHRILLDLSTGADGRARLVTTNFDLLFESCDAGLGSWGPRDLPSPDRPSSFEGVIHLHGRTNTDYTAIDRNEVVLSSADFGRAYLSEGWATNYIRGLMSRYKIVFVGYSADDPPVQYLLEALRDDNSPVSNLYAFQGGDEARARENWAQKGVAAIPFGEKYANLWDTLEGWALRSRDPDAWYQRTIESAFNGPSIASPALRGHIATIASDATGAAKLANATPKLPSTWLYVFDPKIRFLKPTNTNLYDPGSDFFDPFQHFGLDRDDTPPALDVEDHFAKREVPKEAWNPFSVQLQDKASIVHPGDFFSFSPATGRIWSLATWFFNSMEETPAIWWAADLEHLHPNIRAAIANSVRYRGKPNGLAWKYWRHILDMWAVAEQGSPSQTAIEIRERAEAEGWSPRLVRESTRLFRPHISVRRAPGLPPPMELDADLTTFLRLSVEYPRLHFTFDYDVEHLPLAIKLRRELLIEAEQMELEVHQWRVSLDTTRPDEGETLDDTYYGLTGPVVGFTHLVQRLEEASPGAAQKEVECWHDIEGTVFERLRIWAAGRDRLTTPSQAGRTFVGLSDSGFWSSDHERDLLFAISDRWKDLSDADRAHIEQRLLHGPIDWLNAEGREKENLASAAIYRLDNIQWLINHGVAFKFDVDAEKKRLTAINPDWKEESAQHIAQPRVSKAYAIQTETNADDIRDVPINQLLPLQDEPEDFREGVRYERFIGYAQARPARAILAIHSAQKRHEPTQRYWSSFFRAKPSVPPTQWMIRAIGTHIERLSPESISKFWYPLVDWLVQHADAVEAAGAFERIWAAMLRAATDVPSGYRSKPDRDWSFEALNSVIGRLMRAQLSTSLPSGEKSVPADWIRRMQDALELPGDHSRHALEVIARQINWLFTYEPAWTEAHVIRRMRSEGENASAFWAGIISRGHPPTESLFPILKDDLLARVRDGGRGARTLIAMVLVGWAGIGRKQQVSDVEMRDALILSSNEVRLAALGHLGDWADEHDEWARKVVPFLQRVWPKQRTAKTSVMSAALLRLASHNVASFATALEVISPRLVPLGAGDTLHLACKVNELDEDGAQSLIAALELLLPSDTAQWPYDAKDLISDLAQRSDFASLKGLGELALRADSR